MSDEDRLSEFFDDNYPLMAIMGIFGSVTVLLNSVLATNLDSDLSNFGTVASLFIFGLATFWTSKNAYSKLGFFDGKKPSIDDLGLVVIATCTTILFVIIVPVVIEFDNVTQVVFEVIVSSTLLLGFVYLYSLVSLPTLSMDEKQFRATSGLMIYVGFIFSYESNISIGSAILSSVGVENTFLIHLVISAVILSVFFSEVAFGYSRWMDKTIVDKFDDLSGTWNLRTSIMVATAGNFLPVIAEKNIYCDSSTNYGYLILFESPAQNVLELQTIIIFILIIIVLHRFKYRMDIATKYLQISQLVSIGILIFGFIEVIFLLNSKSVIVL